MPLSKKLSLLILVAALLQGCGPTTNIWADNQLPIERPIPRLIITETPTATTAPTVTVTETITLQPPTSTPEAAPTVTFPPMEQPPSAAIQRVIIVSFDGLRADAVNMVPMKNLQALMSAGAYTLKARTINYAVTLPAHASMLSGTCQSKHGIWWDTTMYYKGYSKGVDIFDLAHAAGLKTVMVVNKEKMRQLAEPETTDVYKLVYGIESTIIQTAIDQIPAGFDLMFIHFGSADNRGHKYGWLSGTQFIALRASDAALGKLILALEKNNIRDSTLLIVTADHGGHGKTHDGSMIQDLEIPWIAYGPGVPHMELTHPVSIMDTAATAAYALELPLQPEWDGIPVYEAFGLPSPAVHPDNFRICK